MDSILIALVCLGSLYMAYRTYGRHIATRVLGVDPQRPTPSVELKDGVDYVPTDRNVVWGHHFTSIAGAAPIVGPAIGVIWGWVPALLWVVLGTIFMGGVHDLGALIVSMRNRGATIGQLTGGLLGERARLLFMVIILFLLWLVIAVFALIIATLMVGNPATVIPVWSQMLLAVLAGLAIYRFNVKPVVAGGVALVIMYATIYVGARVPVELGMNAPADTWLPGTSAVVTWIWIICGYAFIASVLPVWLLLQPRDFINAGQLVLALGALYIGLLLARPTIVAPAVQFSPAGAPPMFPFLFITIACGAISGFHSLVSSGTSAKQIKSEADAQAVGYGGMVAEAALAVVAVLACVAGFATRGEWAEHYASWGAASGLGEKLGAFSKGGSRFLEALGVGSELGRAFLGVVIVSFAMTTIDTATRLQRYIISEVGSTWKFTGFLQNRIVASLVAAGSGLALALMPTANAQGVVSYGAGGLKLWPVFGASNQLLAALGLLIVSVWLYKHGRRAVYAFVPMLIMLVVTLTATILNIRSFVSAEKPNYLLVIVSALLAGLAVWMLIEALLAWRHMDRETPGQREAEPEVLPNDPLEDMPAGPVS